VRALRVATAAAAAALVLAGCGSTGHRDAGSAEASAGKRAFSQNCASCHVLEAANASGTVGPNLDEAFGCAMRQGFEQDTVRDVVRGQIAYASPPMPRDLVKGEDAENVADYVAEVAGKNVDCGDTGDATGSS
jgi:mono/diheme cytochrome c family protein